VRASFSRRLGAAYNGLFYGFLLAPIAIVLVASLNSGSDLTFPPEGFSLRWFRYLAGRDEFLWSTYVSFKLAMAASVTSIVLGLLASLALARERFRGKEVVEALLMSPLVLPGIITGVALLQFFTLAGLGNSFLRLFLGHVVISTPYAVRSISSCLYGIDPDLEESSYTLGANGWRTFRKILLPLLRPGIVAAFLFTFVTSFDNVVVSLYLVGSDTVTLPIRIMTYLEWQFDPSIAAISTIFIAITVTLVVVGERVTGLSKRAIAG
jgi:putative spermidine/putrescine transport system permease protein